MHGFFCTDIVVLWYDGNHREWGQNSRDRGHCWSCSQEEYISSCLTWTQLTKFSFNRSVEHPWAKQCLSYHPVERPSSLELAMPDRSTVNLCVEIIHSHFGPLTAVSRDYAGTHRICISHSHHHTVHIHIEGGVCIAYSRSTHVDPSDPVH